MNYEDGFPTIFTCFDAYYVPLSFVLNYKLMINTSLPACQLKTGLLKLTAMTLF